MTQDQLSEILEEVRRTMDEMVALTERKVAARHGQLPEDLRSDVCDPSRLVAVLSPTHQGR